ncbi:MAG: aminoacyl-tRNA hydrolase [Thermoanaerobaculia bacterium]|nr:aminoacyl-tRNA hydrolase [Thermoanaerobaculia bacterium]MBP9144576.1 aminoacyl-tRNA hydrolase [Thermoanaerobaculia bacterium]MBP9824773.1 aminoacyl-tRNA hydrolase [Thermoanaerobaculia bacterium]
MRGRLTRRSGIELRPGRCGAGADAHGRIPGVEIPEQELTFEFIRSSGPGGQNVNKVSTAVRLRFDVRNSTVLPDEVKVRLIALAGRRVTKEGELVLLGQRHRTQEKNRQDVLARLAELVERALVAPRKRRATKPTRAAGVRRLRAKKLQADRKRGRSDAAAED